MSIKELFKNKFTKSEKIILLLVLMSLGVTVYFTFTGAELIFHSDMATSNLLAREQIRSGRLFPSDWYYGQSIWIFFLNIIIIPLSAFMKSQVLMHEIAALIMIIISVVIIVIFHKKVFKDNAWLISIVFLFCGISEIYMDMVISQEAYLLPLIYMLLGLVLFFKSINEKFEIVNLKYLICLNVYIVFVGLYGVRYIETFDLPLLGAICIEYFIRNYCFQWEKIKNTVIAAVKIVMSILISTAIGAVLFLIIKSKVKYVTGVASPKYINISNGIEQLLNNIIMLIQSLLHLMGFTDDVKLFSILGAINVIKILAVVVIMFVFPILLIRKYKDESFSVRIFIVFSLVNICLNIFLLLFTSNLLGEILSARYLLPSLFLVFFMDAYYIYKYMLGKRVLIVGLAICGLSLFSLSSNYQVLSLCKNYNIKVVEKHGVVNFLKQHNLKYGYATYWNAGMNTVLSDFEVEIKQINIEGDNIAPMHWLSAEHWYEPENYSGKSFILLTEDEKKSLNMEKIDSILGKPVENLKYDKFEIIVYDYNIAKNAWLGNIEKGSEVSLNTRELHNEKVDSAGQSTFVVKNGGVLYGPYINLEKGSYILKIDCKYDDISAQQNIIFTAEGGNIVLKSDTLKSGENQIEFEINEKKNNVEFVINNSMSQDIIIKNISIQKIIR